MRPLVQPDNVPRRERPRADARTDIDAILYCERTETIWRELPASFGAWQTASRRHREMLADGTWAEILLRLKRADDPNLAADKREA